MLFRSVRFEYTSVGTPQQNGRVERKFATLYGQIRSMMIDADVEEELRQKLWAEAANMAADFDNILVTNKNNKNAYELFYNKPSPKFVFILKRFGEVGYILKRDKGIKSKISNRGKKGIMIGYTKQSTGDTYRMFNLGINKITNTRDVKWSHKLIDEMTTKQRKKDGYYTASADEDELVQLRIMTIQRQYPTSNQEEVKGLET